METLTQTELHNDLINHATCEQMLEILSSYFGVEKPKLTWSRKPLRNAYAHPYSNSITMSSAPTSKLKRADVLLHEFAHILTHKKYIEPVPTIDRYKIAERFDGCYGRVRVLSRVRDHGTEFRQTLLEVVKVWYGDADKYEWKWEYKSIAKWYTKRK